jgi:hypothetical protein
LQRDIGTREGRIKGETIQYPQVVYEEREKITDVGLEDSTGLRGNILLNEYTQDPFDSAPALVHRWISFMGLDAKKNVGEIHVATRFGDLILGLFVGQEWEQYR